MKQQQQQMKRELPPTASPAMAPRGPYGPKAPVQLAEDGTSDEQLIRALQARTERVRRVIQAYHSRRMQQPGPATQQWAQQAQQMQAQPQMSVNPFMPPQGPMMARPQAPQPPGLPMMPGM